MKLKNWPESDRPREKLLSLGPACLTDAELLAIFLRTGVQGINVVDLARQLLGEFGGLKPLFNADIKVFCNKRGLGEAKYVQLQAVTEMARRYFKADANLKAAMDSPQAVKEYMYKQLAGYNYEVFGVLYLDATYRPIKFEQLFYGDFDSAHIESKVVMKKVIENNATSVIFAHNHPSGNSRPSRADIAVTERLSKMLQLIDVAVLDHLIVGSKVVSCAEKGMI